MSCFDQPEVSVAVNRDVSRSALSRAADIRGGAPQLARELNVPEERLLQWLDGKAEVPPAVLQTVLDLLSDETVARLSENTSKSG